MIGRFAILLLLFTLPQELSHLINQEPLAVRSASNPSGLKIIEFSYKEKPVRDERYVSRSSDTRRPPLEPDGLPGPIVRNEQDITPSRDLSERMRELRQVSRPPTSLPPTFVTRFLFRAQMKNETVKTIKRFVWSYQPQSDKGEIPGKNYVCKAQMQPATLQKFEVLSPIPSTRVVNASDAGKPDEPLRPSLTDLSIRFVEFEDGSTWQDPTWESTSLLTSTGTRKLGKGKCAVL